MFSAIVAALVGKAKLAPAVAIVGLVPEVDRVAVRVVVDSYQFAVAPSRTVVHADIERFGWVIGGGKRPARRHSFRRRIEGIALRQWGRAYWAIQLIGKG